MKDYYQRKQAIFDSEELSLLEMEVEASKLEDEKRVFDLRCMFAAASLQGARVRTWDKISIEAAWSDADAMLKAAGVVE